LDDAPVLSNLTPAELAELESDSSGGISRRGVLVASGASVGIVALTTAGQTLTPLHSIALLGVRDPQSAPLGVPINRTANQAGVRKLAVSPNYRLMMTGPKPFVLTLADLEMLPTVHKSFPIACVEGWSAGAEWDGIDMMELVTRVGGTPDSQLVLTSLEPAGPYRRSRIFGPELHAALLATHLNGQRLTIDHGYPIRLIAPNRAGVFNTKWVTEITVVS
jgi:DMSO/TMAO reductase YedYZ molybdopterin-dependent catalytic subunit